MSRETIFTIAPPKCLRGEDRAFRPRQAPQLSTRTNFLAADADHSRERSGAQAPPARLKRHIPSCNFHMNAEAARRRDEVSGKHRTARSAKANASSRDFLSFHPRGRENAQPARLNPQASQLSHAGVPLKQENPRSAKRLRPNYADSSQVKLTFTYC